MDCRSFDDMYLLLFSRGLVIALLNIWSIINKGNKVHVLTCRTTENNIHILTVLETHLDPTVLDTEVSIDVYNIFRRNRNKHGGGIVIYVKKSLSSNTVLGVYAR